MYRFKWAASTCCNSADAFNAPTDLLLLGPSPPWRMCAMSSSHQPQLLSPSYFAFLLALTDSQMNEVGWSALFLFIHSFFFPQHPPSASSFGSSSSTGLNPLCYNTLVWNPRVCVCARGRGSFTTTRTKETYLTQHLFLKSICICFLKGIF